MKKLNLQLVAIFCLLATTIFAQKKAPAPNFEEGLIRYKIEMVGDAMPNEQAKQIINGTNMVWYIKGKDSRFEVNAMNGFAKLQFLRNEESKTNTLLLDIPMFADKIAVSISDDDEMFKKLQGDSAMTNNAASNIKFKGKKKIAKHRCKKGRITPPTGQEDMFLFVTEKIRPFFGQDIFKRMGGFPMGMEFEANGIKVKLMATSVEKKALEQKLFTIPEGYEMKTMEEFQEEMKGKMGGGGIGL